MVFFFLKLQKDIRKDEIMQLATTWTRFEGILLSNLNQRKEDISQMPSLTKYIEIKHGNRKHQVYTDSWPGLHSKGPLMRDSEESELLGILSHW